MSDIKLIDFLDQYLHSSNELGDIYRIPKQVGFKPDYDSILELFVTFEIKTTAEYVQIIVIKQKGSLKQVK